MNAGSTMERVYLDLKARIVAGDYPPGTRLDPFHLAKPMSASATPVREALHRLSGERIVDSWHQEGFRQPLFAEADLRDLYGWAAALLALALRSPASHPPPLHPALQDESMAGKGGKAYPGRIAQLFRSVALLSDNREIRYAIANLVERTQAVRCAEARADPAANDALALMEADFDAQRWPDLRSKIMHFHRRRIAWAGRVAAELRPRSQTIE